MVLCSKILYKLFTNFLKTGSNAHNKRIPPFILSLPIQKAKYFLQSYFEGDGGVSRGSTLEVSCTSVSKMLLKDLEFLLARFGLSPSWLHDTRKQEKGIVANFYKRKGKEFINNSYKLRLFSTDAKKFCEEIGFWLPEKNQKATALIQKSSIHGKRHKAFGDTRIAKVKETNFFKNKEPLYNLTVADNHNLIVSGITSFQCDGDEDAVMLLLDTFLNFSRAFLPDKRGGRMDAPLVITSKLDLNEVDDEVFDFDLSWSYPLSFYEATTRKEHPSTLGLVTAESKLASKDQFHNWGFTHATTSISNAPVQNTYTEGEMIEKLQKQLGLAEKIRAVDERDVAERIINTHFLPDIKGNLRTFAKQKTRCTKCNKKYRRPPLSGVCNRCGNNLIFTVHRGGIEKYLEISKDMILKYHLRGYLSQQIDLLDRSILSIFGKKPQSTLDTFK